MTLFFVVVCTAWNICIYGALARVGTPKDHMRRIVQVAHEKWTSGFLPGEISRIGIRKKKELCEAGLVVTRGDWKPE